MGLGENLGRLQGWFEQHQAEQQFRVQIVGRGSTNHASRRAGPAEPVGNSEHRQGHHAALQTPVVEAAWLGRRRVPSFCNSWHS